MSARTDRCGHPSYLPYAAAKASLNALTEGLAKAYGPTVRVNTLMPGPFLTDISKAWGLDGAPDGTGGGANPFADYALQRAGNPSEIVGAALFLMSDASSYTTGSILHADASAKSFKLLNTTPSGRFDLGSSFL